MLAWVVRLVEDKEKRARLLILFWVVSTGVLILGFSIILWRAFNRP